MQKHCFTLGLALCLFASDGQEVTRTYRQDATLHMEFSSEEKGVVSEARMLLDGHELPPEAQVVYLIELQHWQGRFRDTDANLRVLRGLEPLDTTVYGGMRIHRYAEP